MAPSRRKKESPSMRAEASPRGAFARSRAALPALLDRLAIPAIGLLAALVILHHVIEWATVLVHGVMATPLTVDFQIYRCGASDMSDPYGARCGNGEAVGGFVYPPPSLIYFRALALLDIDMAFVLHTLVVAAALAVACALLLRQVRVRRAPAIAALLAALAIAPIGTSFAAGQVNVLVMAACVAAVCLASRRRQVLAGIAVATGFWLKLYPAIVAALFLPRRKWPAITATALAAGAMAVIALLWSTPALMLDYVLMQMPRLQGYTMPGMAHSIAGIAAHIVAGGGQPIGHFVAIPPLVGWAAKLSLAGGIGLAIYHQVLTRDTRPVETLAILLAAALVSSPNAWGYHYALIFPAMFVAMARALDRPTLALPVVLGCWLAMVVPDWTDPPAAIAEIPWLNVAVRGRYALVALVLIAIELIDAHRAAAARGGKPLAFRALAH